jgi:hypothetical protein
VAIVLGSGFMLLFDRQFSQLQGGSARLKGLSLLAILLFLVLTVANVFSTIALCGTGLCPDNPEDYELFQVND